MSHESCLWLIAAVLLKVARVLGQKNSIGLESLAQSAKLLPSEQSTSEAPIALRQQGARGPTAHFTQGALATNESPPTRLQTPRLTPHTAVASDLYVVSALLKLSTHLTSQPMAPFALLCALLFVPLAASAADRHTVFTLIDESGTMKADRTGWRKEAASMLAFALNDGSSMALSGFGNVGRKLDLTPRYLDSSPEGTRNRNQLATSSMALVDSDQQTDLFDAIHQTLAEVSKLDPAIRRASPPAIVLLSDFQVEPTPGESAKATICGELRAGHVDLVLVGFGRVDSAMASFLASCAETNPCDRRQLNFRAVLPHERMLPNR